MEASVAWYHDMLGFELERIVRIPEDEGRLALLHDDGSRCAFVRDNTGNIVESVERP